MKKFISDNYKFNSPKSSILWSPWYQTILAWGLASLALQLNCLTPPELREMLESVFISSSLEGGTEQEEKVRLIFYEFIQICWMLIVRMRICHHIRSMISVEEWLKARNATLRIAFAIIEATQWCCAKDAPIYISNIILCLPRTSRLAAALRGSCWLDWSGDTWHSKSLYLPSWTSATYRWNSPKIEWVHKVSRDNLSMKHLKVSIIWTSESK